MISYSIKFLSKEKALSVIILIAIIFRFVGTNPGYNQFHSDEGITYSAAVSMIKNGNLDPLRYDYPSVVPLTNYVFFRTIFIPLWWGKYYVSHVPEILDGIVHIPIAKLEAQKIFQTFVLGEREINALFWGRYVTALISLSNVIVVYFLTKKLFSKKIALFAAFLLAVNFKAVVNSHIGLPDTYNAFFMLLSLLFSYRIIDKPSMKNYLFAGVFFGLSVAIKYQIFTVFPLLFSHVYVSFTKKEKLISPKIILAGLVSVVLFIILNPYVWIHLDQALDILSYVSKKYSMGIRKLITYPIAYFYHIDYGPPIFTSVVLGILYTTKKYIKQSLFLLAEVIPFFFILIYYSSGGFYIRNFVTITPILMIFAAVFINFIFSKIRKLPSYKFIYMFLIIGLVFVPLKNSFINSYYNTKQWSYKEILLKSQKILPQNAVVASHPFDPLPENIKRVNFDRSTSYSLSEFREEVADYALINMDWAGNDFYNWMLEPFPKSLHYFNKPINQINNIFTAVSIEEMMNFVGTDSYKPWQAPDAALFLIKVPYFIGANFTSSGNKIQLDFENIDYLTKKRIISEEIKIQPNYVYKVTGLIKSKDLIEKNKRNVFLRIDFFSTESLTENKGIQVSVSPRYYGEGWQEIELITQAPQNAKFARISFQSCDGEIGSYMLKNIVINKSDFEYNIENNYKKIEFDKYKDLLYPYSHGNL